MGRPVGPRVEPSSLGFATLFLGLVVGPQPLELVVGPPIARVELRVGERTVAELSSPPWKATVDFGGILEPSTLVAIGRDAAGREVERIRQDVNRPRPSAEARLMLTEIEGRLRGRLRWRAPGTVRPESVRLRLDGVDLAVDDPADFVFPPLDPTTLHFVRAEVVFSEDVRATAERVFGGTFGAEVVRELSAIAVRAPRRLPHPSELAGSVRRRDLDLRVVAVEREPGVVFAVRAPTPAVLGTLQDVRLDLASERLRPPRRFEPPARPPVRLPEGTSFRFVFPRVDVERISAEVVDEVVPSSTDVAPDRDGELERILGETSFPDLEVPRGRARLADAVAIAGVRAAGSDRPRVVVLITDGLVEDSSRFRPEEVERYLERLRVPLVIWRTGPEEAAEDGWSEGSRIDGPIRFRRAAESLVEDLERQAVLWVEGRVVPEDVEVLGDGWESLAAPAEGPRDVGRSSPESAQHSEPAAERPGGVAQPDVGSPTGGSVAEALAQLGEPVARWEGFRLYGSDPGPRVRARWQAVLSGLGPRLEERYGIPVREGRELHVALLSRRDYERARAALVAGPVPEGELGTASGTLALVLRRPGTDETGVLLHEVAHLLLPPDLAPWLAEGLAEDVAMGEASADGELRLARLSRANFRWGARLPRIVAEVEATLRRDPAALDALLGAGREDLAAHRAVGYPLAGLWVRFLLETDPDELRDRVGGTGWGTEAVDPDRVAAFRRWLERLRRRL